MQAMQRMNYFLMALLALALISLGGTASGDVITRLSSTFIARGEQAILEVVVTNGRSDSNPEIPEIKGMEIRDLARGWVMSPNEMTRGLELVYRFFISGYEVGRHTIPPVTVMVDGIPVTTDPVDFMIFNQDDLQWSETKVGERTIRYATLFLGLNDNPFEGETTQVEMKVFVPKEYNIEDWGIPEFERDGVTAWRFQPQPSQLRSQLYLLGQPYVSMAYPSTVTATKSGAVSIGPAKVRLMIRETVMDPTPRFDYVKMYADIPKLQLEAKPLPEAPDDFDNAVGNFRLLASSGVTEIREGDPLTVDLIVSGHGNLDTLQAPKLANAQGWKVYPTTTEQRGAERVQFNGNVVFHQSIRPLEMKREIPPFKLVYFDPSDETFKTLLSDPIPLRMIANIPNAKGAPATEALAVPVERMGDILEVLHPAQLVISKRTLLPPWFFHAIGALIGLALIVKALWMRYGATLHKDPARTERMRELREISNTRAGDDVAFLKAAGAFIEQRLGGREDADLKSILTERDQHCFRDATPGEFLNRKRRHEIVNTLRKAALACIAVTAMMLGSSARAEDSPQLAQQAYQEARYDDAARLWLQAGPYDSLAADTLYNIGNACYRAGSPGQAALYYRRALDRNPSHGEALQNLRFLERKFGAITVQRPDYQYAIAKLPLDAWKSMCWTGAWLCGLALLVFPATRYGDKLRIAAVAALIAGPILGCSGLLGWRYFPNDAQFAPIARQAVIIGDNAALHVDAARTAPEVIDAPPGSLCEVLRVSGRWAYVSFATKTRGWVESELIEKVRPDQTPQPPKFRKPKGDGKTA